MLISYVFGAFLTLWSCGLLDVCDAKICANVIVRNTVENLKEALNGCTIVIGQLQIALITNESVANFEGVSFPELRQIWGLFLLFFVRGLRNLGDVFPNLEFVRGTHVFQQYVFIIYNMPDLHQIGLKSLKRIERGSVMIGSCENLCYFDTIDWEKLNTTLRTMNQTSDICPSPACVDSCKGYCWSHDVCQDSKKVETCPKFKDGNTCVDRCPPGKVILHPGNECITLDQCQQIDLKKPWFAFNESCTSKCPTGYQLKNQTCEYCGDDCVFVCTPKDNDIVSSLSSVKSLQGCTHINGSLRFNVKDSSVANELQKYLTDIKEIWGFLEIRRSTAITSLEFLKNLELIRCDTLSDNNSFIVLDNPSLNKLWTFDSSFKLKIRRGNLLFHYNPQLCYNDIVKLNEKTVNMKLTSEQVSEDNGNQRICQEFLLNTDDSIIHATNATIQWQNFTGENLRGYFLYHIENDKIDNESQNACNSNAWNVVFTTENAVVLQDLKPFTNYSFYIVVSLMNVTAQPKTKIHNFTTLSDDPSSPRNVEVLSHNATAMQLTWEPPLELRGVLDKYVILYHKIPRYEDGLKTRNYCKHPITDDNDGLLLKEESFVAKNTKGKVLLDGTCDCKSIFTRPTRNAHDTNTITQFEKQFNDYLVLTPYLKDNEKYIYHVGYDYDVNGTSWENGLIHTNSTNYTELTVAADKNNTLITDLDHFSTYVFYIKACNENRTARQQCSGVEKVYNRTRRLSTADKLSAFAVATTKTGVVLNWTNPDQPNSLIVSYTVECKGEASSSPPTCVRPQQVTKDGYTMHLLLPGSYELRVRANTLAGPGEFTTFQKCYIVSPYNSVDYVMIISLVCVAVVVIAIGGYIYFRYKTKKEPLIQSINPDYCGYVRDEWEVDRTDVDIHNSLGKGLFGVVYSGYLKTRNMPCAVKTTNINATYEEKMKFLNEGSVMKSFSNAHHVIKLLAIVSKGPSPLVIMELMERGDLKTFLRKSRESSQSVGCNEMYRMAIEIADGMAFLASRKFVHRDLAARNCMVAADHTIKIGDFGMARDIYETDYYRQDSKGLLPVRWMAPESLADGVFTTDSDMWSYGVVLWEMVTLSEQPYQGLGNGQVWQFVVARGRLKRPPECPDILYAIMDVCWRWLPNRRPQFTDIVAKLERHVSEDFKVMSYYHSREGIEHRLNAKERPLNDPAMPQTMQGRNTACALYHRSDENIDLYNGYCDPIDYPSNPIHNQSLLVDYGYEEDHDDPLPGSNGYASLSTHTA